MSAPSPVTTPVAIAVSVAVTVTTVRWVREPCFRGIIVTIAAVTAAAAAGTTTTAAAIWRRPATVSAVASTISAVIPAIPQPKGGEGRVGQPQILWVWRLRVFMRGMPI